MLAAGIAELGYFGLVTVPALGREWSIATVSRRGIGKPLLPVSISGCVCRYLFVSTHTFEGCGACNIKMTEVRAATQWAWLGRVWTICAWFARTENESDGAHQIEGVVHSSHQSWRETTKHQTGVPAPAPCN